jgi:hypothetical protein
MLHLQRLRKATPEKQADDGQSFVTSIMASLTPSASLAYTDPRMAENAGIRKGTSLLKLLSGAIVFVLFTSAIGIGLPISAHAGRAHQDFPPKPGATPIIIGLPNLNPTAAPGSANPPAPPTSPSPPHKVASKHPKHSADASIGIATRDSYVRALLSRFRHRAGVSSAWKGVARGRVDTFALLSRQSVSGKWLALGRIPYSAGYSNVKTIKAYVSMARGVVEELQPGR